MVQIHNIIDSAIKAKRRVDGIDGNVTFNEAKAIRGEFSSKFEELVEVIVPRLTKSLMAIAKEYPSLWDFQRIHLASCQPEVPLNCQLHKDHPNGSAPPRASFLVNQSVRNSL